MVAPSDADEWSAATNRVSSAKDERRKLYLLR